MFSWEGTIFRKYLASKNETKRGTRVLVTQRVFPSDGRFVTAMFSKDNLTIIAKYLLPSPFLLTIESRVDIGYGSKFTSILLSVLKVGADTDFVTSLLTVKTKAVRNFYDHLRIILIPSVAMHMSAWTSFSSDQEIGLFCLGGSGLLRN